MNAYELADLLEERHLMGGYAWQSANMLRQQADRIAELEKQLDIQFKNGFETGKLEGWKVHKYHTASQTKPLSDEEITDVFVTCLLPDGEFDEHDFARAILRKAQEK